jgi:3D (Asp-Asp-Asp) domain-containing protein
MSKYAVLILPFFIVGITTIGPSVANKSIAESLDKNLNNQITTTELVAQNSPVLEPSKKEIKEEVNKKLSKILLTGYSSSLDETDETPFVTASGNSVRFGVVAANFLPFGTKIRLPKIFGDQIFIVEDRLHENYSDRIDIWFPTKEEALRFGVKISEVEIFDNN